ncbi:MAG TPA: hypothetical protein VIL46_08390, partial [Gemmataceae bacterium]
VGGDRGELWMVNPATGEVVADLPKAHRDAVHTATFSPGGLLATGSRDRTVRLWGEDGALVLTLWLGRPVRRVRFADDGRTLTVLLEGERGLRRFHLERLHRDLSGLGIDPGWQL